MPYRDFTCPDGRVVRTRISDEATLEWWTEREQLIGKGYPDRPPDIDTETMRSWIADRRSEEGEAIESNYHGPRAWPIANMVLNSGPGLSVIKLIISWLDPGDLYRVRLKAESGIEETLGETFVDTERYFSHEQADILNEYVTDCLTTMSSMAAVATLIGRTPHWLLTPPSQVVSMLDQKEEAAEDYDREHGTATQS